MNVKERYLAAYRHEPVDRVPIALSYYHAGFARRHFASRSEGTNPVDAGIEHHTRYNASVTGNFAG